jgi:RNA polymerase sigma-70 factor (ECF subfamily)
VVLERLTPAERAAFVLHDVFQFSFDDVSEIVGRTPAACRQLASRARQRVQQDSGPARFAVEPAEQRLIVERFIAACTDGDLEGLFGVLDLDVAGDVDLGDLGPSIPPVVGRDRVARNLLRFWGPESGVTMVSQPVNGEAGILAFLDGRLAGILVLGTSSTGIDHIHAIANPTKLAGLASVLDPR